MKKKALRKDFYMELKKTLPRFLSILMIVFLGVAFFSGVRAAEPDMKLSADRFYDRSHLMDLRVVSTLGLTDEDVKALEGTKGIRTVMPAYSADVLCDIEDNQLVVRLMSEPDKLNKISVSEGRMPEKTDECLADTRFLEKSGYKIGDRVTVRSGTKEDIEDSVKNTEFTIVGSGSTSYYLSLERGTTTVGSGELSSFLIIPQECFSMKAYTDIYMEVDGAKALNCYEDGYEKLVDKAEKEIEKIKDARCEARYKEVKGEAEDKLRDAEEKVKDGEKKLADGRKKLKDGEKKLADGKKELREKKAELKSAKAKLSASERELADGRNSIADGRRQIADGRKELNKQQKEIEKNEKLLTAQSAELQEGKKELSSNKEMLQGLQAMANAGDTSVLPQIAALEQGIQQGETELAKGEAALEQGRLQLQEGKKKLEKARIKLEETRKTLDEKDELLAKGETELNRGKAELADGESKLSEAEKKLNESEKELQESGKKFEKEEKKAKKEIQDAKKKIADGKKEIDEIEFPEWFILDRQTIQTYVEYGQDTERIGAIGQVFPMIFFLVAALVSLTTMTRMVEEERTQIGTLKALGYGKWEIARKYLYYAFLASILGSILGAVLGQKLLPAVIINAYKILYNNLPDILTPLHTELSLAAAAAAIFTTVAAAMLACYKELLSVPAELMRPASPKAGKRVLLERIGIIWRHLNFTEKATVRNLFRYKKRFFMTVLGIGGCTALLLVGYGLKDSILSIGTMQFGKVFTYDATIGIDEKADNEDKEELLDILSEDSDVKSVMEAGSMAVDAGKGKEKRSAYLIVPEKTAELSSYINLQNRKSGAKYEPDSSGIIISEKLATLLKAKKGDTITLKQSETTQVKARISGIAENYFNHYVYMSPSLYQKLYKEEPEYNVFYIRNASSGEAFEDQFQKKYMEYDAAADVSFVSGTAERIADMLKSMDTIIYVLVISAGMLAFVVLYNLNNINISERKRELATLKVLGFFDMEVSAYVFRENIMLTLIGTAAGLVMGLFLHRYVIVTAEIEILMFGRNINLCSYLISIALTVLFSFIVNVVMHFKLRKVDMVESMKSVE